MKKTLFMIVFCELLTLLLIFLKLLNIFQSSWIWVFFPFIIAIIISVIISIKDKYK